MPTVQVTGLQVIAFYVSDLQKSNAFYTDHLGFEETEFKMDPGIVLRAGTLLIYLEEVDRLLEAEHLVETEVSPCFAVDSVRDTYQKLKGAGIRIVTEYVEYAPTFALFRIGDPDGNLIEFAGKP